MTDPKIERVAVVAAAANGAIGKDGWMPWELPDDLKRFKALTLGKPMIIGRVTFEAIGRPLPKRTSIVVTRDTDWSYEHENVRVCHTMEDAIALADEIALRDGVNEVIIGGGAQIYHLALPYTTRYELTEVHDEIEGDTFLDPLPADQWRETAREKIDNPNGPDYSFVTLDRIVKSRFIRALQAAG